ncbi:lipocalin-like domain-containing protein [Paracraurococcus ruber]|uniref:Lipocalin-like domain-containing protein n=1 Tax=Paracraurococcus ruber TaxID=77675 RepID=A0ABS1D5M3_9PROT|nr:lipocalin-like domain-containing protein [Paracraurococcus ruber]MBK1662008.1 hypothetical protein [Paracraurococcus ruber]TDG17147.1 hypothetical protein E2C05_28735 [Paracraurococcus ruber]
MRDRLIGCWRLLEVTARDAAGRAVPSPYGPQPMGVVRFEADRMMAAVGDGRAPAAGEGRFFASYTGTWTFDGTVLSTRVDAAYPPERIGSDQVRQVRMKGAHIVLTPPPREVDGVLLTLDLEWEKVA